MKDYTKLAYPFEGLAVVMTAIQQNSVFQLIQFIITILGILVSIAYTIWQWHKKASEDGKIDSKEVEELVHIIKKGSDQLTDAVKEKQDEDKH